MRNLLYPMTRAIYGYRIREPYASEFAISGRLATDFLTKEIWNDERSRVGAEICLTIAAITGNYRVCQTFLGPKAQPDRGASDLVAAMRRTVGALFSSMDSDFPLWSTIAGSQPVTTFGTQSEVTEEPVRVNRKRLREMFSTGVAQLEPVFPFNPVRVDPFRTAKNRDARNQASSITRRTCGLRPCLSSRLHITNPSSVVTTSSRPWFLFTVEEL